MTQDRKRPNMEGSQNDGNRGGKEFAQSGKAPEQGQQARRDHEGPEGEELRRAGTKGKSRARDEDPVERKR